MVTIGRVDDLVDRLADLSAGTDGEVRDKLLAAITEIRRLRIRLGRAQAEIGRLRVEVMRERGLCSVAYAAREVTDA